jgi:hypothetical protein
MRAAAETTPSDAAEPPPPEPGAAAWLREHLPSFLVVALAGTLVAAFFLGLYWAKRYDMPIGWDTPRYLDQANLVAAHGLSGVPRQLPPPIKTLPSRGATPIVLLTLSSLFGVSTFKLAAVVPPAAAMALALAAGALVSWTLRRGPWSLAAAAVLMGTSAVAIRLMAPETYSDNLLAAAVLTAALVPLLRSASGGPGFGAAAILIGAGAIAHSPSFVVVALAVVLASVLFLPGSWRSWREGLASPLETPSARLAGAVGVGGAIAAVVTFGVLRVAPDTPKVSRGELVKKLREDVPLYRYWLTGPLAALGAVALFRDRVDARHGAGAGGSAVKVEHGGRPRSPQILLAILIAWIAVSIGGVALYLLGRDTPAHRFLSFLIPLPILMAAGVLWLGRLAGRSVARGRAGRSGRAASVAVVGAAVIALGAIGYHDLYTTLAGPSRGVEWLDAGKVQDAATAAAYLDAVGVPRNAPVVFVVDDRGPNPLSYVPEMAYMLRAVLPADRVPHAYIYVGDPDAYLAGKPTYRPWPRTYDANADRFWPTIRTLLPDRPVALMLSSFDPAYGAFAAAPPIPSGPRVLLQGALIGGAALVVLTLVGLGWAFGLTPTGVRPFETFALAPAFGIAFLVLGGIAADAVGIRLAGAGGASVPIAVGVVGAAVATGRAFRARAAAAGTGGAT